LKILRSLYEDTFIFEDVVAAARIRELSSALTAVTCSFRVLGVDPQAQTGVVSLAEYIAGAGIHKSARMDEGVFQTVISSSSNADGWLFVWVNDLSERHREWEAEVLMIDLILNYQINADRAYAADIIQTLIVSTLSTITMAVHWVPLKAIIDTNATKNLLSLTVSRSVFTFVN
jgi:hypothetical protein